MTGETEEEIPKRRFPGHIERGLSDRVGSSQKPFRSSPGVEEYFLGSSFADSAGQPWAGRDLSETAGPYHRYRGDPGGAGSGYCRALEALTAGSGSEAEVVAALARSRLFVPIVAQLTGKIGEQAADAQTASGLPAGDKESDMALVTLSAPDGRRALPVFSDTERLTGWHPGARPAPVSAQRAALSAVSEQAQLMVVDPAAEQTFVVRRPALWAISRQSVWIPSYQDPQVLARVRELVTGVWAGSCGGLSRSGRSGYLLGVDVMAGPGIHSANAQGQLVAGGGPGPELRIVLLLREGLSSTELSRAISWIEAALAGDELFAERVDSVQISVQAA